ncbi:MAG: hypothetical protein JWQ07_4889 [Ramlibacter sp.]|nr:hypothetical protein [Ramlibacter sp.]
MTLTRRRAAALAAGLLLDAGVWAQGKKTALVVGYTATPEFGAIFVAKEQGIFDRHGLDVTLQLITASPNVPAAVVSNSIQIGGLTPPVLLQAIDSGLDLVGVAGGSIYDNASRVVGLVARNGVQVNSAQDLEGRKVGVPAVGATIHVLVRRWLIANGVNPQRVVFVEVPLPQMPDVLKGGSVDMVATAEPFIGRIVQAQIGTPVPAFSIDIPSGFSTVLYASTRQWATSNGAAVKAFREATSRAIAWANANREQALGDIGKYFKVPAPVLRATPWPHWEPQLSDQHLRFWVEAMRTQDMLKKQPMLSAAILK